MIRSRESLQNRDAGQDAGDHTVETDARVVAGALGSACDERSGKADCRDVNCIGNSLKMRHKP